jgi:YbbR domain-containing protein
MSDFFRRYILHNFSLKVLSLLLASGLWLVVKRDPRAQVELAVPIEFHHFPENLEIASSYVPQAEVRLAGPERAIRQVRSADVHLEIDLRGTGVGERTFDLVAQRVRLPRELEVLQIVPGQVHLAFDTREVKQVDIHPRVTGQFADGLRVARVLADPPTIFVSGPRLHVQAADAATTDPIDASGTMQQATYITNAYVNDPLIQVVKPTPIRVTVIMEKSGVQAPTQ